MGGTANIASQLRLYQIDQRLRHWYDQDFDCPDARNFDAIDALATAVTTHRYRAPGGGIGNDAIVMNKDVPERWNTIMQTFPWADICGTPYSLKPDEELILSVLSCLPVDCRQNVNPLIAPRRCSHANGASPEHPQPLKPTTLSRFDLSEEGRFTIRVYDVAGRALRTLINENLTAGVDKQVFWDGLDDFGKTFPVGRTIIDCRALARRSQRIW